nr:MAG TPA: hypothetical protein [Caudoviricetes sp.]
MPYLNLRVIMVNKNIINRMYIMYNEMMIAR